MSQHVNVNKIKMAGSWYLQNWSFGRTRRIMGITKSKVRRAKQGNSRFCVKLNIMEVMEMLFYCKTARQDHHLEKRLVLSNRTLMDFLKIHCFLNTIDESSF